MDKLVTDGAAFVPDGLLTGNDLPTLAKGISLKAGQGILKRGSVLCLNADNQGELVSKINIKPTGETPGFMIAGILADDTITAETTGVTVATIYQMGCFNENTLIFAQDTVLADVIGELKQVGIYTSNVKGA